MYDIMPFCFIYTFLVVDPWALSANRSVRRHHTFVTQTTCFLNSPCWRTNWKNTSTKCRWLDLGARMLFKQQMPGLKKGWNHDVLPGIWSGGFQFHLRDLVIRLLVVDRRTCWIHASLFKFYLKFWQIDLSIYLWWIGFLCLVWCAYWICFYYCLPHTWMGEVVEESWRCRVVSVYGQGQCALPHCKWFFVKIFW